MTLIAYLVLTLASYFFSVWTWNRCMAAGGNVSREPKVTDIYFALSVPATIWALTVIL